ncbi:bifunctional enoyl-CoA hydratase/phosphate acetyltransferase [Caballeronia sp. BR00000012568055]|uniref:bifunctional enoyl-CoA hydratase/phosphate acetyltransferase n=1 Tax=Caballeronia sp. BR00000012568055 TaxID=2918761 RepID=UPI0023F9D2D2|nr:bifunctional enoyl-CoA hydratase/phosphate acetyltransferase [Caballeronia sp. BR00000012568055]
MNAEMMSNVTLDDITPGLSASLTRKVTRENLNLFAAVAGEMTPPVLEADLERHVTRGDIVTHSMWTSALVSSVLATRLPGAGAIQLRQTQKFCRPVHPGDVITATVCVRAKLPARRTVTFETRCTDQKGDIVMLGSATVIAPDKSMTWPVAPEPDIFVRPHDRYARFVREARMRAPMRTAVVHPCSPESLAAAIEARDEGLIDPLLIGPVHKIQAAAQAAMIDLTGVTIEAVEHSHAAAARAVEMGATGHVGALMKGSLHTEELLSAVLAEGSGLRTDRRMSHVYAMDVPTYSKALIVTDAAVNIAPDLEHKRDICQNAVDLLHLLGVERPLVAVLAAVETVNPKMAATIDAASLTAMAMRGQITGATVDGPLAFDNAISAAAASTKGIVSPVAGDADILLAPDLEAANILAKQMMFFGAADAAGLVLGARIPVVITSRADSVRVRIASVALAKLVTEHAARRPR